MSRYGSDYAPDPITPGAEKIDVREWISTPLSLREAKRRSNLRPGESIGFAARGIASSLRFSERQVYRPARRRRVDHSGAWYHTQPLSMAARMTVARNLRTPAATTV